MLRKIIVQRLVELRRNKGISQEKLAEESGLDRTYISGVERMTRNITLDSLEKILTGLGVSIENFLKDIK